MTEELQRLHQRCWDLETQLEISHKRLEVSQSLQKLFKKHHLSLQHDVCATPNHAPHTHPPRLIGHDELYLSHIMVMLDASGWKGRRIGRKRTSIGRCSMGSCTAGDIYFTETHGCERIDVAESDGSRKSVCINLICFPSAFKRLGTHFLSRCFSFIVGKTE
jgi:hypothetical protein